MAAKSDGAAVCESASRCLLGPEQSAAPLHPRAEKRFSLLDCCWVLCALLVFFSDGATDLWLAADYYLRRDYWWFGLTLVFVVVPSAVVQVLSFRWFVYDYSEMSASPNGDGCDFSTKDSDRRSGSGRTLPANGTRKCCRVFVWLFQSIIHILQLGQMERAASLSVYIPTSLGCASVLLANIDGVPRPGMGMQRVCERNQTGTCGTEQVCEAVECIRWAIKGVDGDILTELKALHRSQSA
ncbi:hypothetical protein QQF64_020761 [Cirrhinus molitorella]|uniref:XK-related protein n=1 Tax=Cirrhinus molitorella TaxID=172907 RepID=A0ABR3LA30_9TELE